ncbi:uncharacterized protein LOC144948837 [Lampetra fluviatilis]
MEVGAAEEICLSTNKQLSDLLQELCELRERGSFCDVVVEVQSCRYLAHKAVLSSTSGYFRSLFLGAPCSNMGPFVVDCVGANAFELALDFVYKGTVTVGSLADLGELHRSAQKLGIVGLEEACSPFLPVLPACPEDASPAANADELNIVEVARVSTVSVFQYGGGGDDGDDGDDDGDDGGGGGSVHAPQTKCSPAPRFGAGLARGIGGSGAFVEWPLAREPFGVAARAGEPAQPRFAAGQERRPHGFPRGAFRGGTGAAFGELVPAADYRIKVESPDEELYEGAGDPRDGLSFPKQELDLATAVLEEGKQPLSFLRMAASPSQSRFAAGGGVQDDEEEEDEEYDDDDAAAAAAAAEEAACAIVRCRACGEAVEESVSALREHSCGHLDMERLACRVCGLRFGNISDAVEHALLHTGVALLACKHCGHKFLSPEKLSAHARGQCKKRKYKGIGTRLSNVRQLKWQRQAVPAERATCGACGAAVAGCMSDLRDHGLVHLDVENQRCRLCGYVSLYKSNLVKHSLVHIGVYLYSCPTCRKSFLFKYEMDRHVCLKAKMETVT